MSGAHNSSLRHRALLAGTDLCDASVLTDAKDERDDATTDREGSAAAQSGEKAEGEEGARVGRKGADEIEDEEEHRSRSARSDSLGRIHWRSE